MSIRLKSDIRGAEICRFSWPESAEGSRWAETIWEFAGAKRLVDFLNLHVVINRQIRIANGRTCRRRLMAGADGELFARTLNRIGVAIAPGARHGQIAGRGELAERSAAAIQGDESALGCSDLQQICTDSGQGDGLRWSRAFIGCGHFLKIIAKDCVDDSGGDEKGSQSLHRSIFILAKSPDKERLRVVAVGGNIPLRVVCCVLAVM